MAFPRRKILWGSMRAGPLVPSLESRMRCNFSFSTYTFKILRSVPALRVNLGRSGAVPVLVLYKVTLCLQ